MEVYFLVTNSELYTFNTVTYRKNYELVKLNIVMYKWNWETLIKIETSFQSNCRHIVVRKPFKRDIRGLVRS